MAPSHVETVNSDGSRPPTYWRVMQVYPAVKRKVIDGLPKPARDHLQDAITQLADERWPWGPEALLDIITINHAEDIHALYERHPLFPGITIWVIFVAIRESGNRRLVVLDTCWRTESEDEARANLLPSDEDTARALGLALAVRQGVVGTENVANKPRSLLDITGEHPPVQGS